MRDHRLGWRICCVGGVGGHGFQPWTMGGETEIEEGIDVSQIREKGEWKKGGVNRGQYKTDEVQGGL